TYFYSATSDGKFVVRTAVPYDVTLHQLLSADYGFMWTLLAIMTIMCLLGYMATRRVGEHVSRLNRFAEKAERGERIHDTGPFPHDELGEISEHIVRLYSRMQQAVTERDREHQTVIRQQQEKSDMKRRLTNNINHELKTPVASMQLCLDTLLAHPDMTPSQREEILTKCARASQRLARLLDDVAAITRLDDGSTQIALELVDIAHIVAETIEQYTLQADAKGIRIVNGVTFDSPIPGNRSLMESVIGNLLSNAIEYSGGSMIEISQFIDS
ncbi:MAG: HAMP domain-containing histidine kinase, partial [Paramuribaculum sp.]|nr:HAMP domain-containing histidine kinase [Paramuribaculum sp.]